jgi:hypothetical protein
MFDMNAGGTCLVVPTTGFMGMVQGQSMLTCEDYKEMANRVARLAMLCTQRRRGADGPGVGSRTAGGPTQRAGRCGRAARAKAAGPFRRLRRLAAAGACRLAACALADLVGGCLQGCPPVSFRRIQVRPLQGSRSANRGLLKLMPGAPHLGSPGGLTPYGRLISESVSGLLLQFLWLRLPSGRLTDSRCPRHIVEGKRHQGSGDARRGGRDRGSRRPIG